MLSFPKRPRIVSIYIKVFVTVAVHCQTGNRTFGEAHAQGDVHDERSEEQDHQIIIKP
jgi:hypothetical protein